MDYRSTIDQRYSSDVSNRERDIPSFIEPRPPLILNPFMRTRPQKGTNLLEKFEEDDSLEEDVPELVQVFLRLKPSNVPSSLYEVRGDQCLITSVDTATAGHGRRTQHNVSKMYTFSHIFGPEANQKEIFEHVVKGNLRKLPDGNNFTLLTYGASGSGKTYTLMGTVRAPGLVPRSLEYVFKVVEAAQIPLYRPGEVRANKLSIAEQQYELQWVRHLRQVSAPLREKYRRMSSRLCGDMTRSTVDLSNRTKHYVWVSFVEIYNEAIYDLLTTTERTAASKLRIREDPSGNVYVKGATQAFVRTGEEAYDVMVAGKHNLQVHATGVHAHSSRSHCIFTITMLTETELGVRASHVRLCDLAGSERARRTRNTGARMQESRAINSSLHVLERCLHTLRRKQTTNRDLVPYRESKLTRLLGSGLSGMRGEAVSMVVTLNPAPEYAHETRHVLQLAAVARDIQVNNTIAESVSTLESSCSQDTTIASSAEVSRLRADNERLHYELVQAEALNRKLVEDMAEQQQENAVTVKELVEEARDITQQYYTQQVRSLEERRDAEIAELREEYEAKLAKAAIADEGTPSRALQNKVMQLTKQIAILEEELNAERLARARMNEEMQHLRACIEERDEKAAQNNSNEENAIQLTDSEDDSEEADDICNDSLEPTFKKEDINRSRLMRQSSILNHTRNITFDNMDKTHESLKDDSIDKDITDDCDNSKRDSTLTGATDATYDVSHNDTYNQSMECPTTVKKADVKKDSMAVQEGKPDNINNSNVELKQSVRETYFVSNSNVSISENEYKKNSIENDTGNFADISVSLKEDDDLKEFSISGDVNVPNPVKHIETQIDKIKRLSKSTAANDSLARFEKLELEVNDLNNVEKSFKYFDDGTDKTSIISRKKEKKTYFDDKPPSPHQMSMLKDLMKKHHVLRSPSIVQDEIPENHEPTTISEIMRESFTVTAEVPPPYKNKVLIRMQDSIDPFEEVDSPCPKKQDTVKSVENIRKSIGKVSLSNNENEINSEIMKEAAKNQMKPEIAQKEVISEAKLGDTALPDDTNFVHIDVNVPSASKETIYTQVTRQSERKRSEVNLEVETCAKVNSEVPLKVDILTEVKKELTNAETVDKPAKEIKTEELPNEISSLNDVTSNQTLASDNNTIDAFENIYKDITAPRATDFEHIVSEISIDTANEDLTKNVQEAVDNIDSNEAKIKQNVESNSNRNQKDNNCDDNSNHEMKNEHESKELRETNKIKYNLRHKTQDTSKTDNKNEIMEQMENYAPRTAKKSLRLRRRNKVDEPVEEEVKLKDMVNLQKEFSDVTMGVPAPVKLVTDVASPEDSESENRHPITGVQSCPSKSVTRSRRKLFTPRVESLDESPPRGDGDGDGDGESCERVRVPRPSYHRARARTRRRLN